MRPEYEAIKGNGEPFHKGFMFRLAMRKFGQLRMNQPLTQADLDELDRLLLNVGAAADIERAKAESHGLGLFVRSLVGLEREAAKRALDGFLIGKTLGANQIEFLDLIVNHLTEHGIMDASLLYESPFTDITPQGPEALFTSTQLDDLVAALERVRTAAVAA
jgi:type I restriction enzyme, R subunit